MIPSSGNDTLFHYRDMSIHEQPVKRNLSTYGRKILCNALISEYKIYIQFLKNAQNINHQDFQDSIQRAKQNCPDINFYEIM